MDGILFDDAVLVGYFPAAEPKHLAEVCRPVVIVPEMVSTNRVPRSSSEDLRVHIFVGAES
eukprot:COSAG01_NODE_43070_length_433_cov_1.748503_1_plen_60_part_10